MTDTTADPRPRYDPELIGQMVRWWRKMGNEIPQGQPRTSRDGEELARLANAQLDRAKATITAAELKWLCKADSIEEVAYFLHDRGIEVTP